MKKQLLSISILGFALSVAAQTVSPSWSTVQNANYSITTAGTKLLDAVSPNVVWATGYDGMAPGLAYNFFTTTNNGGATFTSGNVFADTNSYIISNIEGIDANTAWVSAYVKSTQDRGALYYTNNGGASWQKGSDTLMFSTAGVSFADFVCFLTPHTGIALGDPIGSTFEMYRTKDGGATWAAVAGTAIPNATSGEYGLTNSYTKLENDTNRIWYGTNKRRIFRSTDAGQTWSVSTISGAPASMYVNDIAFVNPTNGLVLGTTSSGTVVTYYLFKTADGGATWTSISPLSTNLGHNDLCAIPGTSWFASAGAGTGNQVISYSTDNGMTWNSWGGASVQYLSIDFVDNQNGWAGSFEDVPNINGGMDGGIFKYSDVPLGISNIAPPRNISVYPNPSNGNITVKLPVAKQGMTLTVMNTMGQIIFQENIKNIYPSADFNLNLQDLPTGVYVIKMNVGEEVYVSKIDIQ